MLLIPDEVMPAVFDAEIAPYLAEGDALVFAWGYTIAFGLLAPPPGVDVALVAPRMIGAGVRDLYVSGHGFPAFIGVEQDHSGQAKELALALARGIGATHKDAVEVTFAQEAELDLFTEQCFGPAFGQVLTTAVDLLLETGYPPEAVLLELYMSGELAYTLAKIAEMGLIEQTALHSRTSQYGSLSRGTRFLLAGLRARMQTGLDEIHSGAFAREWAAEQAAGAPTLASLKEAARSLPLSQMERELQAALGYPVHAQPPSAASPRTAPAFASPPERAGLLNRGPARLRNLRRRHEAEPEMETPAETLERSELEAVLRAFLARLAGDPALRAFAQTRQLTVHYHVMVPIPGDADLEFFVRFRDGAVSGGLGAPDSPAEVQLTMSAELLDAMLTGCSNAMRAALSGRLSFGGDARLAVTQQQIQDDLIRLYSEVRQGILGKKRR
jgi:ketol-acid reductoisomerase